jgi:hypothetical protein
MTTYSSQPDETTGIDTYNASDVPTTNNDANALFLVGEDNTGNSVSRGLIKFDLSSITSSAVVSSATLTLTHSGAVDRTSNARTMRAFRTKRAWVENQTTWNIWSTGNNWSTAGGFHADDCEQTDVGSVSVPDTQVDGVTFDIVLTNASVQEMISGAFTNNGWLIKVDTEMDDRHAFASSSHATASYRPKLVIEYILGGQVIIWSSQ